MRKSVCIICGKDRDGLEVKSDYVIKALRWLKRNVTKNEKNYRLVVCKECFLNYRKRRNSYERKSVIYATLGILFLIALVIVSGGKLGAIAVGVIITMLLVLMAQLSYMPAVAMPAVKERKKEGR